MTPAHFPTIASASITQWLEQTQATHAASHVLCLLPEGEIHAVDNLQRLFRQKGIPLLGAIFPALITDNGFSQTGVTFIPVCKPDIWFLIDQLDCAPATAASHIAKACHLTGLPTEPQQSLFLIFDGMLPNISTLLVHLFHRLRQQVHYTGVNAGSESFTATPCLFDQQRIIEKGVIGITLQAAHTAVQHCYPVSKPLMRATSTQGNQIDQIDGQPAMAVYQKLVADEFGVELTPENFYDYAVHYPFGLIASLQILVRIPVGFTKEGAIICVGEIPPNSMLRLLRAPKLTESRCVEAIQHELGPTVEQTLMTFYCAGRRMHFGADAALEIQHLAESLQASSVHGALSLGEISTDHELGIPEFHNAALVCLK